MPRTRIGTAWVGVCAGALVAVALIIFAVQNTRNGDVSFLGMATSTPLALALLIGAVNGILLTLVLGIAHHPAPPPDSRPHKVMTHPDSSIQRTDRRPDPSCRQPM